jgi:hypothetical protein
MMFDCEGRKKVAGIINTAIKLIATTAVLFAAGMSLYFGCIYSLQHPDMTRTQIFLANWQVIVLGYTLAILGMALRVIADLNHCWPLWWWVWCVHPNNQGAE